MERESARVRERSEINASGQVRFEPVADGKGHPAVRRVLTVFFSGMGVFCWPPDRGPVRLVAPTHSLPNTRSCPARNLYEIRR